MERKNAAEFPRELLNLFDRYVHGAISRRELLDGAARFAVGGLTAAAIVEGLSPNYAWAQQVPRDDRRIRTAYATYPSPQGYGSIRAYIVRPAEARGKLPGRRRAIRAERAALGLERPQPSAAQIAARRARAACRTSAP